MSEPSGTVKNRIQSTRRWLNRAEEHFGRNAAVRGEMDLLLAEAELRSTRETVHAAHRWPNLGWIHQGAAFTLAAVIAVVGLGSAWLWWHDSRTEANPAGIASPVLPPPSVPVREISTAAMHNSPSPAAVEPTSPGQEVNRADRPASRDSTVSPDEMRRLVQTAGQSLRGRTKP